MRLLNLRQLQTRYLQSLLYMHQRKKQLQQAAMEAETAVDQEEALHPYGDSDIPNVVYAAQEQAALNRAGMDASSPAALENQE